MNNRVGQQIGQYRLSRLLSRIGQFLGRSPIQPQSKADHQLVKKLQTLLPEQDRWKKRCTYDKQGRLIKLSLHNLELSQIPSDVWSHTALEWLDVRNNQLTSLPAKIGQLSSLSELFVDNNQLSSLPAEIGQLSTLSSLELGHNPLHTLPPAIIRQGSAAILAYLRAMPQQHESSPRPHHNHSDNSVEQEQ